MNKKDFSSCPKCNNITNNDSIYQCKSCRNISCSICSGSYCKVCDSKDGIFKEYAWHIGYIKSNSK